MKRAHYLTKRASLLIWICKKVWRSEFQEPYATNLICIGCGSTRWALQPSHSACACHVWFSVPISAGVQVSMDQQWQHIPALKLISATSSDAQTATMLAWQPVTMASVHRNSARPRLNLKFPSGSQPLFHKDRIS